MRGPGRRLLRPVDQHRPEARDPRRQERRRAGELHPARHPVRAPGLQEDRVQDLRHRLGFRSLPDRLGPEFQQFGFAQGRLPARRRGRWRMEPDRPQGRQGSEDAEGPRPVGEDRLRGLGLRRSGPALQHHHERLAHLAGRGSDPRLESVLGVHVPRRHGLQSRLDQPFALPQQGRHDRHRGLRAHRAAVDRRARDLGHDGAVPVQGDRQALLRLPHAGPRLRQYRRPADDFGHPV